MTATTEHSLPTPHHLELSLAARLATDDADRFGWTAWEGQILARWYNGSLDDSDLEAVASVKNESDDGETVWMNLGGVTVGTYGAPEGLDLDKFLIDADEWAGDALQAIEPLSSHRRALTRMLGPIEAFNHVVYLRSAELDTRFRGRWPGVGAWTLARVLGFLALDERTLIVADPAPLTAQHAGIDLRDPSTGRARAMTPAEQKRWDQACQRLSRHWQDTLGLRPIHAEERPLVGAGGFNPAIARTLMRWEE